MSLLKGISISRPRVGKTAWAFFAVLAVFFAAGPTLVRAQAISEGFDNISTLTTRGWFMRNNSAPGGTTNWFQGNDTKFPAASGPPNSYIAADYHNTTGANIISNWLLAPNRTMKNGDVYTFVTSTVSMNPYPDRLQVRLSTNGASTNVGTSPTDVGDFTTLLLDIDPEYQVGIYPEVWTEYIVTISGLSAPTSGRLAFRYFVEDGGPLGANSYYIGIDSFSYTPGSAVPLDFNGDRKSDYSVIRNSGGPSGQLTWLNRFVGGIDPCEAGPSRCRQWGIASDTAVPADFDGDNKVDIAVWRPGAPTVASFYILRSSDNTFDRKPFGQTGDDPTMVRDYTGDGKADPAVYREGAVGQPSYFFFKASSGPAASAEAVYVRWGQHGDAPVPGDYNGDGIGDFVVQRAALDSNGQPTGQAQFFIHFGTGGFDTPGADLYPAPFGRPTDFVNPGDYDGDGKTDLAVTRSVNGQWVWYIRPSSGAPDITQTWGLATDFQVQGDYDGDGRTDIAVWRGGDPNPPLSTNDTFHILGSTSGYTHFQWGQNGDYPTGYYDTH